MQSLRAAYQRMGRTLWVLDVTTDLEIPTFVAISGTVAPASLQEPLLYGFGCHFDVRIAMLRALTEMNQGLPAVLKMRAQGQTFDNQGERVPMDIWPTAYLERHPYLRPHPERPARKASDYPRRWHDDLCDDVALCARIVADKGMELLVLDQTRPEIGLSVVKVAVPGLRPHWKRLAPGRLYDVPGTLKWLDKPLDENSINPVPIVK